MNILIIGSTGFIGSHCKDYFSENNEVFTVNTSATENKNGYLIDAFNPNFETIFKKQQFDVCLNCTGSANVAYSFEHPYNDFRLNVSIVINILSALKQYNPTCKFINFSSASVYGNPEVLPIKENANLKPLSPYGFHKLQSEILLTEYHRFFGLKTCSLRVFSAYGERLKKQLFWDLYLKAKQSNTISLFGTGFESRDFIYVTDLVNAVELIIKNASFVGEAVNVASGVETPVNHAASVFIKHYDSEKKLYFNGEQKAGDPINWRADIKVLKSFGFVSKINLEEGLLNYVSWLKESE
jgi:dTDP-glucose 4,6-dehydratase/UDP-glucose 4-epimerase